MEDLEEFFDKLCRVCTIEKKSLVSIYSDAENNQNDIPAKLMACAKINVQHNDKLPKKICSNCLESLNASYDFQAMCKKSDVFFQSISNNLDNPKARDEDGYVKIEPPATSDDDKLAADFVEAKFEDPPDRRENRRKSQRLQRKESVKVENTIDECNSTLGNSFLSNDLREKRSYTRRRPLKFHKCETCDKTYKNRTDWRRHFLRRHGIKLNPLSKKIQCSICHDLFPSWKFLKVHVRESGHYAKETCEHCNKTFSRSYMSEHLRSHTGEQPFLCTTCGKHFWVVSIFKKHTERCANMEKKYKCSYCDSSFYTSFASKVHERIHTKEKPYVCETCGKAFRLKSKLVVHQNIHADLRPHQCSTCGRKFRQRAHLKEHLRIHTGVKPYICDICGTGFTQGHSLKTHQMRHPTPTQDRVN